MVLRILGVYGVPSIDDAWLLEDMALLHDTLPTGGDVIWLSSIKPQDFNSAVQRHGHPRARRVLLPSSSTGGSFSWLTTVKARRLKSRFLEELSRMAEFSKSGDMLIVCINTHGTREYGMEGAVQIGHKWMGHTRWVECREVLRIIKRCLGNTTLIVNACYSGYWVDAAFDLGLDSGRVTVITGSGRMGEIHSHSLSGSGKFRGGYFLNNLVARLYKEYSLFFPRPSILRDGLNIEYYTPFPDSNLDIVRITNPIRVTRSNLKSVMDDICQDMGVLRGEHSTPELFGGGGAGGNDALHAFGIYGGDLPLRIIRTSPPNPNQEYAGLTALGCLGFQRRVSTAELVNQYKLLPLAPNTGCNTRLSTQISRWQQGELGWAERWLLRRRLKGKLRK